MAAQNLTRQALTVRTDNHHVVALYERFGFVHEGFRSSAFWVEGVVHDCHLMKIRLDPPDATWPHRFATLRARLSQVLATLAPTIDHIGSTSLGDIHAKPILDILIGLRRPVQLDGAIPPLLAEGYTYVEAFTTAMPYRRFFAQLQRLTAGPLPAVLTSADPLAFGREYNSIVHLHVMVQGTEHWLRHLAFRDYLRAHRDVRFAYEALKLEIAERDFDDPLHYNAHKDDFIHEHQEKAMLWFQQRSDG